MNFDAHDLDRVYREMVGGRGIECISGVRNLRCTHESIWTPEPYEEPAFLEYSITKSMIATITLRLCEQGHLSLKDPLATFHPEIYRSDRTALRSPLNHTAGIPDLSADGILFE